MSSSSVASRRAASFIRLQCDGTLTGSASARRAPSSLAASIAVEAAMEAARSLGARRALALPVSVPSHCSLMKEAARQLAGELEGVHLEMPLVPEVHNQNAGIAGSVDEIRERLQLQLHQPVRWVESVEFMHRRGITALLECGPGKVLTGLTRRIEKSLQAFAVFDGDSLDATETSLGEEPNAD